jgi:hypothetical protein
MQKWAFLRVARLLLIAQLADHSPTREAEFAVRTTSRLMTRPVIVVYVTTEGAARYVFISYVHEDATR